MRERAPFRRLARGGGDHRRRLPQARDQQRDLRQMEGEAWQSGGVRRQAAEGAGGRERQAQEAVSEANARQCHAHDVTAKNV